MGISYTGENVILFKICMYGYWFLYVFLCICALSYFYLSVEDEDMKAEFIYSDEADIYNNAYQNQNDKEFWLNQARLVSIATLLLL